MKKRLVLVAPHTHYVADLGEVLRPEPDLALVEHYETGAAALAGIPQRQPDLVLVDLEMPDINSLRLTQQLCAYIPWLSILTLGPFPDPSRVRLAIQAGARGFLLKSCPR
ncbi:MAG: DNA-binding response regulator, partial [Bacteroidetes bacterium]